MKTFKYILFFLVLAIIAVSCSKSSTESDGQKDDSFKSLSLNEQQRVFATSGNSFALNLLDEVSDLKDENLIVSPLSMQYLLGMLLNGAQGETADQISKVLGYGTGQIDVVNQYAQTLMKQLPSLDKKATVTFANAVYAGNQYQLLDAFKKSVGSFYGAEVSNVDFSDKSTVNKINSWCAKQTKSLIPSIIDNISSDTKAVLLNATYFNSEWKSPFDKSYTSNRLFAYEGSGGIYVPMMAKTGDMSYVENDNLSMVSLPYGNGVFSMLVILPSSGKTIADVTEYLKTTDFTSLSKSMLSYNVDLWLPRFEIKFNMDFSDILSGMGMPDCFNNSADFTAMFKTSSKISLIKQSATIKVEERGTEASVVSQGYLTPTASSPSELKAVFHADHPFVYLIVENSTKTILFAGKYTGK